MVDLKASGVDAAVATAKQLQDQDHDFQPARALIGDVYMAANRPADAVKAYQDAMTAAPSEMLVGRLTGALLRSGQGDAAIKVLSDWIAQHPNDMVSTQQLADLDIAAKHFDDAVKNLQLVLATKPHDPVALNNLAWVYQQQGDKRAEATAHQAYILSPGGQTADTLGWILVSSRRRGEGRNAVASSRGPGGKRSSDPVSLCRCLERHRPEGRGGQAAERGRGEQGAIHGEGGRTKAARSARQDLRRGLDGVVAFLHSDR